MENETITSVKYKVQHKIDIIGYGIEYEKDRESGGWRWTCYNLFDGVSHFRMNFIHDGPFDTIELAMSDFNEWITIKLRKASL